MTPFSPADTCVLVVDDSPVDRAQVSQLVRRMLGATVVTAASGQEALAAIARKMPDIVVSDLVMPDMDGLALAQAIRRRYPFVPMLLMTTTGAEEIALAALRWGAASYVNKQDLTATLVDAIVDVLSVSQGHRQQRRLFECWSSTQFEFWLDNDTTVIPGLVNHLQNYLSVVRATDEIELVRVGVALHEALRNAIHHGNLELDSHIRHGDPEAYYRLAIQRSQEEPYCHRRVYLHVRETQAESEYIVRDDGPGFNIQDFNYDPTEPANRTKPAGRGLFLIRTFMDEVRFSPRGNEITMSRRHCGQPHRPLLSTAS